MAEIRLIELTKVYSDGTKAVSSLNIDIADGEFLVLVGPSGCGKTSALRMVAGLEEVTAGVIEFGGHTVNKLPPKDRDVAMVFQNYSPSESDPRKSAASTRLRPMHAFP